MAKHQKTQGNSMNKTKPSLYQSLKLAAKMERYCQRKFGMSFMQKMEDRIFQTRKEFTENVLEHIRQAEKVTRQDYLKIKE